MRRLLLLAFATAGAAFVLLATPAGADPAKPTDYRSTVVSVKPPTKVVELRVVGGDGFLELTVDPGHVVVVEGYQGEPYIQVLADGTVQENANSPATYINRTRSGSTPVPDSLKQGKLPAPQWTTIGHSGRAVWHDHRIHFMGSNPKEVPGLAEGRPVQWTVPFTVDGTPTVASGSYRLIEAPSILLPLAIIVVVAVGLVLLGRSHPVLVAAGAITAAGLVGVIVGWQQNAAIPAAAGATPLTVALPAIALVAGVFALFRQPRPAAVIAVLAGVACLGGWFFSRATVLTRSVLPTDLAPGLDRAGTSFVVGAALAAAWLAVRSGALAVPKPSTVTAASAESPDTDPAAAT